MKNATRIIICLLITFWAAIGLSTQANASNPPQNYKAISFNIRMSGAAAYDGVNAWENRKEAVISMFMEERPDFFGVQELLPDQQAYLREHLPMYGMVGVGREDGKQEGECMAIFYDLSRFQLIDNHTFWLSERPDSATYGWDAACKRTLTFALLRDKISQQDIYFFNTHLDHVGEVARRESVKLICRIIDSIRPNNNAVVLLCGDMNSSIEDPIFRPLEEYLLLPARDRAPQTSHVDTYNAYGKNDGAFSNNKGEHVIDHFFTSGTLKLTEFRTLTKDYGVPYVSDHYPIALTFSTK